MDCFDEHKEECSKKNIEFSEHITKEYVKQRVSEEL